MLVLFAAIVGGAAWGTNEYLHNAAYLADDNGKVAIYREMCIRDRPATREEFEALKRQLSAKAQEARSWLDGNEDEKVSRFGRVGELRERRTDISEELRHLRRQRSNIPSKLHAIRTSIAHQLGLSLADLPFVGELIDVNPNEAAWQPAIERLLGGRARTMRCV